MPRLDLALQIKPRGARDMGALARLAPRRSVQARRDGLLHQLMIGGMEAHEIDASAKTVVGVELGRMPVGERAKLEIIRRARHGAESDEVGARPVRAFARDALAQSGVAGKEIVVGERERLVEDFMRGRGDFRHDNSPTRGLRRA